MRAIILAAGLGTRLRPMTDFKPKSLIEIKNKPLIEYQIEYLKEKNIHDIIIVIGYLKEQFSYLTNKYGVRLIYNDKYDKYNNFYSLYLVKEYLEDSYVIDADNYIFKNIFDNNIEKSTYFSAYRENCNNEWFLVYDENYKVSEIVVNNTSGRILSGVSYWDKTTAEKIVEFMDIVYKNNKYKDIYWDDIVKDNISKLDVYVKELNEKTIYEIDSIEDYNNLIEILSIENNI